MFLLYSLKRIRFSKNVWRNPFVALRMRNYVCIYFICDCQECHTSNFQMRLFAIGHLRIPNYFKNKAPIISRAAQLPLALFFETIRSISFENEESSPYPPTRFFAAKRLDTSHKRAGKYCYSPPETRYCRNRVGGVQYCPCNEIRR